MKNLVFFDLETTDYEAHRAEILTAYFKVVNPIDFSPILDFYQEVRPAGWNYEAEKVHGISLAEAKKFEERETALPKIYDFIWPLVEDSTFICYANWNNYDEKSKTSSYYLFDWAVLKQTAFDISSQFYYHWLDKTRNARVESAHSLAKERLKLPNYRMETVAKYYEIEYNAHNAKEDVIALIKIYEGLLNDRSQRLL